MEKCSSLTMGKLPFFPLQPCGKCGDPGPDGWHLSAASGHWAGQSLDHVLLLLQLSRSHAHGLSMEPFHWNLCSLLPGKKGEILGRGAWLKSRLCVKGPLVFWCRAGVWNLRFRGGEGVCVREARARSGGILRITLSFVCRGLLVLQL